MADRNWATGVGEITVTKYGPVLPVSTDMLMEEGLIPDTRPARPARAPVRVTAWFRVRSRAWAAVAGGRLKLGAWIAGVQVAEYDDGDGDDW